MNTYRTTFVSACPINGDRIEYQLAIEALTTIPVEAIALETDTITTGKPMLHEDIADTLYAKLGGKQVIEAQHRQVHISTLRGGA
ncbi:hypothetical protein UFOVP1254_12 [uncultured Caudovirales phage]|uniref:Uncharacterized protein n=1 Tax=uncultured Caudovirales phage TaxID=2100421 RepID=A0A6J5R9R7_9CAUD|nr:hypothetical protein UFOVP1254_12 [uncultured Caudovirales phage]